MNTFTNTTTTTTLTIPKTPHQRIRGPTTIRAESSSKCPRRATLTTLLAIGLSQATAPLAAMAQNWGTRSWMKEQWGPALSPEDAVARIKQTAEGLHSIRDMLENMAWRYVLFYVRLKIGYLSLDLKNAMSTLPEYRRSEYVDAANDLVYNMSMLDEHIRTPRVYESYVYYEKTLKSIDQVVAILA